MRRGSTGLSDFSGKTLALRSGRGEKDVEIFVAILAHSCLIYAEAVPDQRVRHWTMVHRRALEYFGGVPDRWIIDNLKAGVNKPDREEPQLNPSFREFAQHYNVAVLPARSGRATDKGMVEAAVGAVQTRILLALRHETFFSLDTMNAAIRRELERLNLAPMACGESRRALFEDERAGVSPAPAPEPLGVGRMGPPHRSGRMAMCASNATTTRCPTAMSAATSRRTTRARLRSHRAGQEASPLKPTTEDPTKSRERRHAAQSRVVKSHRNNGQMWPELRSSVARIAVKCIGIRSQSVAPSGETGITANMIPARRSFIVVLGNCRELFADALTLKSDIEVKLRPDSPVPSIMLQYVKGPPEVRGVTNCHMG